MLPSRLAPLFLATVLPLSLLVACGDDDDSAGPSTGGAAGTSAGSAGTSGAGASSGTAGVGGAGAGGVTAGGASGSSGQGGAKADLCSAPAKAASNGACYTVPAGGCNPVTNEGCPDGMVCDAGGEDGYTCYPTSADDGALCKPCQDNPCQGTLGCNSDNVCTRYCCDDGDCGTATCVRFDGGTTGPGLCTVAECKADADCKGVGAKCQAGKCLAKSDCCTASDLPGCTDATIQACVCAEYEGCCDDSWSDLCVASVAGLACGKACPGTCTTKADCTDAGQPVCDPATNLCIAPECTTSDDCKDSFGPICADSLCVECAKNADCKADSPVCHENGCVECVTAADCAGQPFKTVCDPDEFICKLPPCATKADCKDPANPVCDSTEKTCVGCLSNSDCKDPKKPTCDADNVCQPKESPPVCDAPATAPSKGSCYKVPTGGCNPVTNEGCAANMACDVGGDTVFMCYDSAAGDASLCGACGEGMFCMGTMACAVTLGKCARYCCDDGDCGPSGTCNKDYYGDEGVGLCVQK